MSAGMRHHKGPTKNTTRLRFILIQHKRYCRFVVFCFHINVNVKICQHQQHIYNASTVGLQPTRPASMLCRWHTITASAIHEPKPAVLPKHHHVFNPHNWKPLLSLRWKRPIYRVAMRMHYKKKNTNENSDNEERKKQQRIIVLAHQLIV